MPGQYDALLSFCNFLFRMVTIQPVTHAQTRAQTGGEAGVEQIPAGGSLPVAYYVSENVKRVSQFKAFRVIE